jgi:hypothetical protein
MLQKSEMHSGKHYFHGRIEHPSSSIFFAKNLTTCGQLMVQKSIDGEQDADTGLVSNADLCPRRSKVALPPFILKVYTTAANDMNIRSGAPL